ncbi:MAG: hypothetical protein JSR98_05990 [Proteobacteria bacterium]|nr:hypothetical protein [Pseudomonadota bacterium]
MKTALLLAAVSLAFAGTVAGAAQAGSRLTDVDYLKANRCKGLAEGLGAGDVASLSALIKAEGVSRSDTIYTDGQKQEDRAKREASHTDGKERLTAELNGACVAFISGGKETASAR